MFFNFSHLISFSSIFLSNSLKIVKSIAEFAIFYHSAVYWIRSQTIGVIHVKQRRASSQSSLRVRSWQKPTLAVTVSSDSDFIAILSIRCSFFIFNVLSIELFFSKHFCLIRFYHKLFFSDKSRTYFLKKYTKIYLT